MSDVIVSTTESTTDVTTTNDVTTVAITNTVVEISQATAGLQGVPGSNSDPTYVFVTNKTGAQLNKGSIVYVSGANGTHTQVSLALATGDVTSARTLGWLAENIANNATGLCCVEGYLDGINTQGVTEGAQLYLSPTTPGAFTATKPGAPDHMVYVGICAKASAGNGRVFVHVQNGAELEELHDVKIVSPANNDLLRYVAGTALWENVAATAVTVGSAIHAGTASYASNAGTSVYATTSGTSVSISGSITKSQVSDFTSGTVASASTAQQAGTAVYATTSGTSVYSAQSGTATYATVAGSVVNSGTANYALLAGTADYATTAGTAVSISGSITKSQVSDFTSGTVASASTAQQAGTSVYATNAGTSVYATTSGTSVTISGSITKSQVSDFTSGTVASASTAQQAGTATYSTTSGSALTITGSITKSQVSDFTSGTVTTISGSITRSQVSDYASGTVANISGTVAQSQVTNLTTSLASKAGTADNNTFTGLNTFSNFTTFQAAADAVPIRIFGANGQSADLFSVNDYLTNTQFEILSDGRAQSLAGIITTVSGTANIPLVVRGTAGQSAAITVWQNSGSTAIATVSPLGYGNFTRVTAGSTADLGYAVLSVNTGATATKGLVVRGAASQSANLQEWQVDGGTVRAFVNNIGRVGIRTATLLNGAESLAVASVNATDPGIVIRGAASQSANLQEWQTSSGSTALRVNSTGQLALNTASNLAQLGVVPASTATVGVVVQGLSGQSANALEIQSSTGSTAIYMTAGGVIRSSILQGGSGAENDLRSANGGGLLTMARATAIATNPGANYARIYFRDGTNAGTLKLVVRAGAAGAETTILDNIPQS